MDANKLQDTAPQDACVRTGIKIRAALMSEAGGVLKSRRSLLDLAGQKGRRRRTRELSLLPLAASELPCSIEAAA